MGSASEHGLLVEMIGAQYEVARRGQGVVIHGRVSFDVMRRRKIEAGPVHEDVASKEHSPAARHIIAFDGRQAAFGIETELRACKREMVDQGVDAGDNVLAVASR